MSANPAAASPTIRRAVPADMDGILRLRALCYPHHPSQEAWLRHRYLENPRFSFSDDVVVAELDGDIVASLVLMPFESYVPGGQILPMTGIASVAVSPLVRRRGVAGALLRTAIRDMQAAGATLSVLYPFEYAFYARYGWAAASRSCLYRVAPASLPLFDERLQVRRLGPADVPAMIAVHEAYQQARGALGVRRPEAYWQERWTSLNLHAFGYGPDGNLEGYLLFEFDGNTGVPMQQDVHVADFAAVSPAAHRGLIGILAAMQEQVRHVLLPAPPEAAWPLFWQEQRQGWSPMVRGEDFAVGETTSSFMLRLIDVPGALAGRLYGPVTGSLGLRLTDAHIPANAVPMTLRIMDGRPEIELESFVADRWLSCDVSTLAQIWSGAVTVSEAATWGKLTASGDSALAWAEAAFRTPHPPWIPQLDVF